MNLLYTITSYAPAIGGTQLHQHLLAQSLKYSHKIQVVSLWETNRTDWLLGTTLRAYPKPLDYVIEDIPVHRIGLSNKEKRKIAPYVMIYYPLMGYAISPIANTIQIHLNPYAQDADLIHNVRQGREAISYASLQAARKFDIPFVFTPAHHPRWVGWRYQAYIELYKLADAVLALTNTEKQLLVRLGVQEERIHVTGSGPILAEKANPEEFINTHSVDGPIILFLGRHDKYKGHLQLLQAANLVWQKIPEAHFFFVGPDVDHSEKAFNSLKNPRIHRLGKVNLQEKTNALAACTLLCVPSTQESFGVVYTEAWWFGKPVIGCPIPAVSEVISDGVDGFLVEQNAHQIAERICYFLLNPELTQRMGVAGRRKVEERYTWEKLAKSTRAVYEKVCRNT
jgi:glycosyltransferase involved in cell wall biosynthesis